MQTAERVMVLACAVDDGVRAHPLPPRRDRAVMPQGRQRFSAAHRTRSEGTCTTATAPLHRAQHRARSGWGVLTRVAGKRAAFTLRAVRRRAGREVE